ncbi:uncharacterized protein, partial [Chelonus insularis]|uniref:uncharacterized protein n=1 Tax=Chelonus insularis TaxID=460826 RepID=UPI001588DE48
HQPYKASYSDSINEQFKYQTPLTDTSLVMSTHRNTSEMYYDCLQCTEYCRHTASVKENEKNYDLYNSNYNTIESNYDNDKYYGKSSKSQSRFVLTNYSHSYQKSESFYPQYDDIIYQEKRHTNRRNKSSSPISSVTPLRKRSSLARPVRIYDSSLNDNIPIKLSDFSIDERSNPGETAYYTGGLPFDDHSGSESGWPIRLRLEEIFELTLSRSRKRKRVKTRKKKKVTLASKHTHFKDTERLLKVLSINNVDQDCRYNVKRCSIM